VREVTIDTTIRRNSSRGRRPTRVRKYAAGAAALLTLTLAAACGNDSGDAGAPAAAAGANTTPVAVKAGTSPWGPILTDQAGRTLYGFTPDRNGTSSCADENCVATWPPLTSRSAVTAGSGVSASLLGSTARTEGTTQATFGQWPLYYYAGDVKPGDTDGQGVDGKWFVVGLDGKLIKKTA
jgi:predicted lipoprotein with Yx(FWY)xxD motif